jgi:hypothetical protein
MDTPIFKVPVPGSSGGGGASGVGVDAAPGSVLGGVEASPPVVVQAAREATIIRDRSSARILRVFIFFPPYYLIWILIVSHMIHRL